MNQIVNGFLAYCGLDCFSCPIRLATLEQNSSLKEKMRIEIADQLAAIYKTVPKPEIITDCDGCKTKGGRLFTGCIDCEIRKCAIRSGLENCAYCDQYACEKLIRHFEIDPGAKERLDRIRGRDKGQGTRD